MTTSTQIVIVALAAIGIVHVARWILLAVAFVYESRRRRLPLRDAWQDGLAWIESVLEAGGWIRERIRLEHWLTPQTAPHPGPDPARDRRRHECAYHEQLEKIADVIGLKPDTPAWMIGDEAVKIIREPILSLAADPYGPESVDVLELTYDVARLWGVCPVCAAKHGQPCIGTVGIPLGMNVQGRPPADGVHVGRLHRAPKRVRLEWSRA